ncbi:MAG: Serine dehydrogenase proteinase [bacterium ADurb.Bin429]|nr:MAG: Serine dehydrogenase proteinase [bacterium ADurb.Bin429]
MDSASGLISQLFWLFIILSFLWPVLRQRMLESARAKMIHALQQRRGSRVIVLIHRQESMAIFGLPFYRYITIEDSEQVLRAIRLTPPDVPIDLVLHTPGGLVLASEQIAMALRAHPSPVTVFVPHYAMSGGTMIAMAADNIVMDSNAVLGPVDPQLGEFPAASILRVIETKRPKDIDDRTLMMADMARKAVTQVREALVYLLQEHFTEEKALELATTLSEGRWTHDYPVTVSQARDLGFLISTSMPMEVYHLMDLYPQPNQRRPSVEYVPLPYIPKPQPAERKARD